MTPGSAWRYGLTNHLMDWALQPGLILPSNRAGVHRYARKRDQVTCAESSSPACVQTTASPSPATVFRHIFDRQLHWVFGRILIALLMSPPLGAQSPALPIKYSGPPTKAEITSGDLMTRLYQFADDSMQGRLYSTTFARKATDYVEREVGRLGLLPLGENGTFYQTVPVVIRALDPASTITVGRRQFRAGKDFAAEAATRRFTQLHGVRPQYLGLIYDTSRVPSVEQLAGKVVLVREAFRLPEDRNRQGGFRVAATLPGWNRALAAAAQVIRIVGDSLVPDYRGFGAMQPRGPEYLADEEGRLGLRITTRLAEAILGGSLNDDPAPIGGNALTTNIQFVDRKLDVARNVIAMVPGQSGSNGEYVVLSAHSDHLGLSLSREEHNAAKARSLFFFRMEQDSAFPKSPADRAGVLAGLVDSLRLLHGGARVDSVYNGADDDASGAVALLEIAESLASARVPPKRSVLFIWHTGEESGLIGSRYFTENPTVPLDSIVAVINLDRVGHGSVDDPASVDSSGRIFPGGPGYLQLLGARRLSGELGDAFDRVNSALHLGFNFDLSEDAPGHPQQVYCRSDHASYARFGIPSVLLTTGGNIDYHSVTDEPQYIDYTHLAAITRLVMATSLEIANLDHRIHVTMPKPNPKSACVQ